MRSPTAFLVAIAIILASIWMSPVVAQTTFEPRFSPFEGTVYYMPQVKKKRGKYISIAMQQHYGPNVYEYDSIGTVKLNTINIPESDSDMDKFPGVPRTTRFCMILYSTMTVDTRGCYEFMLNSDDGSTLWINDQVALNNDGGHQMRMRKDSIWLEAGTYDARLWYFQGYPDRFGLIMESTYISSDSACRQLVPDILTFDLQSDVLFASGEYAVSDSAKSIIRGIATQLKDKEIVAITVTGHTDNVGSSDSNMTLSSKRAESIAEELRQNLHNTTVELNITGKGETAPKATNETEDGRRLNRRVEIEVQTRE